MSTITHKRRAIQRTINWPAYHVQRAHLADLFAVIAYSGQAKRPLALGIKAALVEADTGLSPAAIKHFLRAYTFGPRYLRALKSGAWRYALHGAHCGWVSPNEAEHAWMCLRAHYADREWHRALKRARVDIPPQDSDWQTPNDGAIYAEVSSRETPSATWDELWAEIQDAQPVDEPTYPYRFAREAA